MDPKIKFILLPRLRTQKSNIPQQSFLAMHGFCITTPPRRLRTHFAGSPRTPDGIVRIADLKLQRKISYASPSTSWTQKAAARHLTLTLQQQLHLQRPSSSPSKSSWAPRPHPSAAAVLPHPRLIPALQQLASSLNPTARTPHSAASAVEEKGKYGT